MIAAHRLSPQQSRGKHMATDSYILSYIHSQSLLRSSDVMQINLEMQVLVVGRDGKNQNEEVTRGMEGCDGKSEVPGEGKGVSRSRKGSGTHLLRFSRNRSIPPLGWAFSVEGGTFFLSKILTVTTPRHRLSLKYFKQEGEFEF